MAVGVQGRDAAFMASPKSVSIIWGAPSLTLSHTRSESVPSPTFPLHLLPPAPPPSLLLFPPPSFPGRSVCLSVRAVCPHICSHPAAQGPSHDWSSPAPPAPGLSTSPSHGKWRPRVPGWARLLLFSPLSRPPWHGALAHVGDSFLLEGPFAPPEGPSRQSSSRGSGCWMCPGPAPLSQRRTGTERRQSGTEAAPGSSLSLPAEPRAARREPEERSLPHTG